MKEIMSRNFPTITPGLLYNNASEMIKWLCQAFGFEKRTVKQGDKGKILHAHLVFHNGGITLSSAENYEYPDLCKSPGQIGASTVEIIVFVQDIDKHYDIAMRNGANIIMPLEDKPYGGKVLCCKRPGRLYLGIRLL